MKGHSAPYELPAASPPARKDEGRDGRDASAVGAPDPADVEAFVESFGMAMEGSGLPRGAGRMFAWLLVCDPAEQTAADIKTALHSSTGAISQNLRMLTQVKFIQRVGHRGDRRSFYRVAPGAWASVMVTQQAETKHLRLLAQQGLDLLETAGPERRRRIAEMTDFYTFLERELPTLLQRWVDEKDANYE